MILHVINHDFGFFELLHALLVLATLRLDLPILSLQELSKQFEHACKEDWCNVDVLLALRSILVRKLDRMLMNFGEHIGNSLSERHLLDQLIIRVFPQVLVHKEGVV